MTIDALQFVKTARVFEMIIRILEQTAMINSAKSCDLHADKCQVAVAFL